MNTSRKIKQIGAATVAVGAAVIPVYTIYLSLVFAPGSTIVLTFLSLIVAGFIEYGAIHYMFKLFIEQIKEEN